MSQRAARSGRRERPGVAAALALAAAAAVAGGCLFTPREAEEPGKPPPVEFEQPIAPEIALSNIEKTLEAKYIPHYENSFYEEEVLMEMDPGEFNVAGVTTNPFPDWTRGDEADRMRQVISSMDENTELDVIWDDDPASKWRSGEDFYEDLEYRLVFSKGGMQMRVYEGRVNLYFKQEGTNYYIWRWNDEQASEEHRTWCYLRHVQKWDYVP